MSKAIKTLVAVVAAVAIPFAAPAIASSIGLSASIGAAVGSATAGSVIGGALVGGALNTATQFALGGRDPGRAFLMGAIGGGIGGYGAAPTGAPTAGTGITGTAAPAGVGTTPGLGPVDYSLSAASAPGLSVPSGVPLGVSAPPGTFTSAGGVTGAGLSVPASVVPTDFAAPASYAFAPPAAPVPGAAVTPGAAGAAPAAGPAKPPATFAEAIKQAPGNIAAKFQDPKALADLTLRAAGQLAGSALAGSGLSPEEEQLLAAQRQDLEQLRQTNQALFQQRLDQAQALLGEAKYFDPNFFRQQAETEAKINIGRQQREATRGLTGERRAYTQRQYQLGAARIAPSAGLQAAGSAQQARLQTMQAGLSAMPTSGPSVDYTGLTRAYDIAERRRQEQAGQIGDLFGSLTGSQKSRSSGGG